MLLATLLAASVALPPPPPQCSLTAVCDDVIDSLYGGVIVDGIVIGWETDAEPARRIAYRLLRYDCPDVERCGVTVAIIQGNGTCGTTEAYELIDPVGTSGHTYSLEVWSARNERRCAIDVIPE